MSENQLDFNFHIKPILSDKCFSCHGPDANTREADLRLDTYEGLFKQTLSSGKKAFVSGKVSKSEALVRIHSADRDIQMPPPDSPIKLSEEEKALLTAWVEEGAPFQNHWAFNPPQKRELPQVKHSNWLENGIDNFVLAKLEDNAILPNKKASKEIWLRRVSLDLTGLPPTLDEIDAFLEDNGDNAHEKVIDRLLASPHFGEKMALHWLDLARYADSNGYSQDGLRIMWPWRDWVIQAFNQNMPFDQFIAWQLAGDRMPGASQDQKLATGFLRNHRMNGEGGIIEEEYLIEYAADRTETTATAFLGLTLQCARCHDHKYDPISQKEYYEFFSYFNNVNEQGRIGGDGNYGPQVFLTSEEVETEMAFFKGRDP